MVDNRLEWGILLLGRHSTPTVTPSPTVTPPPDKAGEEEAGAGLGYTAHLVALLSSLLNLPLRFPVTPHCSISSIRDDITPRLDEKRVLVNVNNSIYN